LKKIVACYKWVVEEADVKIKPDMSVDFSKVQKNICSYDRNAIEAAVQLAKVGEGVAVGLTFGAADAKPSLKDSLSRGLEEAYWVNGEEAKIADGLVTAKALAAAIQKIGNVDVVICAEGSSDVYARQTAPRIGAILDWPVVTSVGALSWEGNELKATRKLDDCKETVIVKGPVVIAVLPEISSPPLPSLKAVIAASKKPVTEWRTEESGVKLEPKVKVNETKGYLMNRKNIVLSEGSTEEQVAELVKLLQKEGVL